MSKQAPASAHSIAANTDCREDASVPIRSMKVEPLGSGAQTCEAAAQVIQYAKTIGEVLIHSTIGDDQEGWSAAILSDLFEAQRTLLELGLEKLEVARLECFALTRRSADSDSRSPA